MFLILRLCVSVSSVVKFLPSALAQPDRGRTAMGVETLDPAECFNDRQRGAQRGLVEHDDTGSALKLVGG